MQMPEFFEGVSITRFLQGAAAGVVATLFIGFTWGGWVTSGTATAMTDKAVEATQVTLYSPICVERYTAKATPEQRAEFAKESDWNRDSIIEKTGFATLPDSNSPNGVVADACAATLSKLLKEAADKQANKG